MILSILTYFWIGLSAFVQGISLFADDLRKRYLVPLLNGTGGLLLLTVLIQRSLQIRFVSLTGTFDSLLFYGFCLLILSALYGLQKRVKIYTSLQFFLTMAALALILTASSPLVASDLHPPIPALQSLWLVLHVALSFIGEAFFAFSFITALMALISRDTEKKKDLDRLTYRAVIAGYPVFTIGALIFGAVWAEAAWGSFWSWDPKETWALITWLFYSLYLHFRIYSKKGVALCSLIACIGFLSTLFTFFGVNYLLGGLHSYG